jgi:hypothetical protein
MQKAVHSCAGKKPPEPAGKKFGIDQCGKMLEQGEDVERVFDMLTAAQGTDGFVKYEKHRTPRTIR